MELFAKSKSFDSAGRKIMLQIDKLFMCNEAGNQ
jgi:hypothetical protein